MQPALVLNKLDRLMPVAAAADSVDGVAGAPPADEVLERIADKIDAAIEQVNGIVAHHNATRDTARGVPAAHTVALADGSVCFGSAYFGWLVTLESFATLFAKRAARAGQISDGEVAVYASKAARQIGSAKGRETLKSKVLAPLVTLHTLAGTLDTAALDAKLRDIGGDEMALTATERALADPKAMRRAIFRKLLPASPTLLHLIKSHLPSPAEAQARRGALLLGGGGGDGAEEAMPATARTLRAVREADPAAPLYIYVAKFAPLSGGTKGTAAVARVLSGTLRAGVEVYVLPTSAGGKAVKGRVSRLLRLTPTGAAGALPEAHAGTICGFIGLEKTLSRAGTVSSEPDAPPVTEMEFSVSPVEFRAVSAGKAASGARRLAEALPLLQRSDPLIKAYYDKEVDEHVVAAAGELHLEVTIHRLRELMGSDGESLRVAPASFAHRETAGGATPAASVDKPGALGKTANKHNRLWFVASPLSAEALAALDSVAISAAMNPAARARALVDLPGPTADDGSHATASACVPWTAKDARRILAFGPDGIGPNVLVDATFGIQGVDGIVEHLVTAFQKLCESGPLAGERLRGVRIDLVDAKIHGEAAQRKAPQVVPAAQRGMSAALLGASPLILEPLMEAKVEAPLALIGEAYDEFAIRRADDIGHEAVEGGRDVCTLTGALPLVESPGLSEALRGRTGGRASALRMRFAGWRARDGNATLDAAGGEAGATVHAIRARKGLGAGPPLWTTVADRL